MKWMSCIACSICEFGLISDSAFSFLHGPNWISGCCIIGFLSVTKGDLNFKLGHLIEQGI